MTSAFHEQDYLGYLVVERGVSPATIDAYGRDLAIYVRFLDQKLAIASIEEVTREDVVAFEASLIDEKRSEATVARRMSTVKGFHRFLLREGLCSHDPAQTVRLPRRAPSLPSVLSVDEVARLLDGMPCTTPREIRDAAILEVLYGCGLRASELVGLDVDRVHFDEGFLLVMGKGSKERLVPLSGEAAKRLARYLAEARSSLSKGNSSANPAVFLNARGRALDAAKRPFDRRRGRSSRGHRGSSSPHPAPFVRDPSSRRGRRSSRHPGDARPCGHRDDADLHPYPDRPDEGGVPRRSSPQWRERAYSLMGAFFSSSRQALLRRSTPIVG